ncbi:MAG: hypothetical protein V4674_02405 [Patescibacteria group bacterium]
MNQPLDTAPVESFWNPIRRMFALWVVVLLIGFYGTQYGQDKGPTTTNVIWLVLGLLGVGYMKKVMPFSDPVYGPPNKKIFWAWFAIVFGGIALTQASFYYQPLTMFVPYLGALWLFLMALGHAITGLVDKKSLANVYAATTVLQVLAGLFIIFVPMLMGPQFLFAGVVSALAMVLLIAFA